MNNAGIRRDNILALMPEADWERVLDITLGGFYNVTQPLLQPMMFHKFGRIINMASISGLKGMPGQTNYSAAKGGIIAATKALAQEVARKNVTVNARRTGFHPNGYGRRARRSGLEEDDSRQSFSGSPKRWPKLVGLPCFACRFLYYRQRD